MSADTVFISYSHDSPEHSQRVLAFSNKLGNLGVDAELDQYHTRPPQGWPQWCEEQLRPENSKLVLIICTETYRKRVENQVRADEGRGVYWEGSVVHNYIYKDKANERFIPVLFGDESDENVPIRLQGYSRFRVRAFELNESGFEALYRELTGQPAVIKPELGAKVLLGTKTPVAAPLPEKAALTTFQSPPPQRFPLSNIPITVPLHFLGRDEELEAIDAALGRVAVVTLHGLRGVGKTTLAAAYAERHQADYRATWWVRAETADTLRADLVALGVRLGWVGAEEKEEPALEIVRRRLRDEGEGLLIIYDNAIDAASVRPYLPGGGAARVLVTSNSPAWRDVGALVEVRLWPKKVGADYLIARTGRDRERAAAEALSEALDGLTLAHEQAAAYCEQLRVPLAEYRKRFEGAPARLLDAAKYAPAEYHGGLTVSKSFALAIDEAAKLHAVAEPLIAHAALLAPEPIPLFLFSEARETFGEPLASQLEGDGLDEAVGALLAFALVERETIADERDPAITTETIRLHRLVRAVAAQRFEGEAAEAARRVLVAAMARVYPRGVYDDPSAWPRARRLDALAVGLVAGPDPPPAGGEPAAMAYLLYGLASYRRAALADYSAAQHLIERALAIHEKARGLYDPMVAADLNNLASLLQDKGDITGARPLFERALAIYETALGPEHPSTATSLNNLALLLRDGGDLAAARPLFERALAIDEKAYGLDHPKVATDLNNLALLLQDQGDLAGARPLHERALSIREKSLGQTHPLTNLSRANLAFLRLQEGAPSDALALGEVALAAHAKVLGAEHPRTKNSARVTARALDALGRGDEARAVRKQYGIEGAPA